MSASWFDPGSWFGGSGGDGSSVTAPVAPVYDNSTSWGDTTPTDTNSQIYPDPGSPTGYSDINGNQVDSTGQPVNYDSSGQLIDSNGNVIGKAGPYQAGPNDQTITPGGYDAQGNPLDASGRPIQPGAQQPGAQQPGQKTGTQNKGVLGNLLGNNNTTDTSGGGSGLLGTLGMLAAGAGAGYLLSNLLSNKASSSGTSTVAPAHAADIAAGNLQFNKLANPGTNPGYAMGGAPGAAVPMPTNLGQLPNPGSIQTINPVNSMPSGPIAPGPSFPGNVPSAQSRITNQPITSQNSTLATATPLLMSQINSLIGA